MNGDTQLIQTISGRCECAHLVEDHHESNGVYRNCLICECLGYEDEYYEA